MSDCHWFRIVVAHRASLKHQLVYYYFQTLHDLIVATYAHHMARNLERVEAAIGIAGGHNETRALIEWCIDQLEP